MLIHVFVLYVLELWIRDEEQNRGCVSYLPLIDNGSLTLVQYRANYDALTADIKTCLSEYVYQRLYEDFFL